VYKRQETNLANRTMIYGGIAIGLYVVYHLMHLTWRNVHTDLVPYDHHNVYGNVILSFQNPALVAVYMVALAALCLHLIHGFQSALRTNPTYVTWARRIGIGVALVICVGCASVPIAVLAGVLK
jgi:succinate dehydrogenase / fumarate reductase cytochrome b subunit